MLHLRSPVGSRKLPESLRRGLTFWRRSIQARVTFSYSLDGEHFVPFGDTFISRPGVWTGAQIGLFAQAANGTAASTATTVGYADFDWFRIGDQQ